MLTIRYLGNVLSGHRADLARQAAAAHFEKSGVTPRDAIAAWILVEANAGNVTPDQHDEAEVWRLTRGIVAWALGVKEQDVTVTLD
jgi:hypothetical protein